jgi:hypothetical protein
MTPGVQRGCLALEEKLKIKLRDAQGEYPAWSTITAEKSQIYFHQTTIKSHFHTKSSNPQNFIPIPNYSRAASETN